MLLWRLVHGSRDLLKKEEDPDVRRLLALQREAPQPETLSTSRRRTARPDSCPQARRSPSCGRQRGDAPAATSIMRDDSLPGDGAERAWGMLPA